MGINYTIINHEAREKFGLTWIEYGLADLVHNLSNNPKSIDRWCYASKDNLAKMLGISRQYVHRTIEKLVNKNIIEKHSETKHLRTTQLWYETVIIKKDSKQKLQDVNKVYIDSKQSLHYNDINKESNNDSVLKNTATMSQMGVTRIAGFGKGLSKPELNQGIQVLTELLGNPPSYIPKNRFSLKRLIKKRGLEQTLRAIRFAFAIQDKDFAPVITSYMSLERKWDDLEVYARRKTAKAQAADVVGTIERRHRGDLA